MSDPQPVRARFDAFELDERAARLTREGRAVPLPPKAFAVLCTLARQPGQLVTKSALLDAVWGHQHVSESVLKTTISELRAALSDDARQPRYIETASRLGYRFVAALAEQRVTAAGTPGMLWVDDTQSPAQTLAPPSIIGRRGALARLRTAWEQAAAGRRQLVWIAGEAGVGKTTLIDTFVTQAGAVLCVHGQCVGQFGAGEPYLPVLEALGSLCRKDHTLAPMMHAVAPTWLLQLPWLASESERDALRRELSGISPERMLRELAELLDRYTERQPLLLITEDLHWSDQATVRLMDHVARRRTPARLMWLGSFRVAELVSEDHPLKSLRYELRMHKLCEEILLDPFSEQEVAAYVDSRFPGTAFPEAFVRRLHTHTDGLPLFLVNVIDDLVSRGRMQLGDGQLLSESVAIAWQVPENLAGVMETQIARLPADQRSILEAASVCGVEFRPQTVAEVLDRDVHWVGERCDELARQQNWIGHVDLAGLPDGSLSARYAFRHALYRHVFYQRIAALARARMHRCAAVSLERGRAAGVAVTAAELASHYELGHEPVSALRHYADAADNALRHFAPVEAVKLTGQALGLLPRCPDDPERLRLELAISLKRGVACSQAFGMGSQEARTAYERAQALCDLMPERPALGWALNGLGLVRYGDGDYRATHALGTRILALAERHDEPNLLIAACNLLGMSCAALGQHRDGQQWLQRGIAACDGLNAPLAYDRFFLDPGVTMRGHLGLHLLPSGLFDQARVHVDAALTRARALNHPISEALALQCACMLEIRLQRPERVASLAASMEKLADQHGIVQAQGARRLLGGWALAQLSDPAAGHALILEGHAIMKRVGTIARSTQILGYAVEALAAAGRWDEARAQADEAMQLAQRLDERTRFCDLHLLHARIALAQGQVEAARASMHASLAEARAQEALGYELAAWLALCELPDAAASEVDGLAQAHGQVTEGFDTALVTRARDLLVRRSNCSR
jgi:DNA-binding winged helix-turn-helix (wHTH) protein